MGQPWGLSGPEFLGVYAAGMAATITVPLVVRQLIRYMPGPPPARELDEYEVGYLAGGPKRVFEVAIAELTAAGALRADSSGDLHEADVTALKASRAVTVHKIGRDGFEGSAGLQHQYAELDPGIESIEGRLRAEGLAVPLRRVRVPRIVTVMLVAALLGSGIARGIEAFVNQRPAGFLFMLFMASIFISMWLIVIMFGISLPKTTTQGRAYLRRLRAAGAAAPGPAATGSATLLAVALLGFTALPDADLREALLAGVRSWYSFRSSSASSGSSGGHSCGGHGCGGGGCGGGGCGG